MDERDEYICFVGMYFLYFVPMLVGGTIYLSATTVQKKSGIMAV